MLKAEYHSWVNQNDFLSMLPKDTKAQKKKVKVDSQTSLNLHLKEIPVKMCVIPYSDKLFQQTAIEWLVSMDQVSKTSNLFGTKLNYHSAYRCPHSFQVLRDDWHCLACYQWCIHSWLKADSSRNPQHIQKGSQGLARASQCKLPSCIIMYNSHIFLRVLMF